MHDVQCIPRRECVNPSKSKIFLKKSLLPVLNQSNGVISPGSKAF